MSEEAGIKQLDHELAEDELAWMQAVYEDFGKPRLEIKRVVRGLRAAPNHLRVLRASSVICV